MSDKTKAQKWKQRLKDDCEPIGEPLNWSHADTRYFGHIHDLADCGYDRAEEVAASVAALTERVDGLERVTSKGHGVVPVFGCECAACNALRFRDGPSVEEDDAALPERSAPAPVTITRAKYDRLVRVVNRKDWKSVIVDCLLRELGIEVEP